MCRHSVVTTPLVFTNVLKKFVILSQFDLKKSSEQQALKVVMVVVVVLKIVVGESGFCLYG